MGSTVANYLERWNKWFGWPQTPLTNQKEDNCPKLVKLFQGAGISRKTLATGIGVSPSFLGKVLTGQKPCPKNLLHRAQVWLQEQKKHDTNGTSLVPGPNIGGDEVLEVALSYQRLGWSIVPQLPGKKRPPIP